MITPEKGLVIAGRYELVWRLATGGQGSVWAARDSELERRVAVKLMLDAHVTSPEARARFAREARAPARLGSQHVVQVYDSGVEDETPFIVMELLKGESLGERLTREGRLPQRVVVRILVQVCKALRTAHDAGLVHRDLKPSNILLALKDEDEVVQVLDFGIAKAAGIGEDETKTDTNMVLGSPQYMSPEQIRSPRDVDLRADLWSLGVILYRALTGRLPFPAKERGDLMVRICTDAVPPPTSVAPDLPVEMDRFFERALARDPANRFQSARELLEAFCAIPSEISAAPSVPPPAPRLRKGTIPMRAQPAPQPEVPCEPGPAVRSEATTKKMPERAPQPPSASSRPPPAMPSAGASSRPPPPGRPPHQSGADDPTFAVVPELQTLQTEAALVSDRMVDPPPRARPARGRGYGLWPVWAAVAVAAAAAVLAIALQPGTGPSGASSSEPAVPSALPPTPPELTTSSDTDSPPGSTTASAAPRASASSGSVRSNPAATSVASTAGPRDPRGLKRPPRPPMP